VADLQITYYAENGSENRKKRLYLRKDRERWHVLYEGNVMENSAAMANIDEPRIRREGKL